MDRIILALPGELEEKFKAGRGRAEELEGEVRRLERVVAEGEEERRRGDGERRRVKDRKETDEVRKKEKEVETRVREMEESAERSVAVLSEVMCACDCPRLSQAVSGTDLGHALPGRLAVEHGRGGSEADDLWAAVGSL